MTIMNVRDPIRSACLSLKINKLRSSLTTLGIVIGVSAVITVVGLIQGFKGVVMGLAEKSGSNSVVVRPVQLWDIPPEEFRRIKNRDLTLTDMRALADSLPHIVQSVTPFINSSGMASYKGVNNSVPVLMTDETWLEENSFSLSNGRNFVSTDIRMKSKSVIIGYRLIEKFGISGNPIGQFISFQNIEFEIIGVLDEIGANMVYDPDDVIVIAITAGLALLPEEQRRAISFRASFHPVLDPDAVEDIIRESLRHIRRIRFNEVEGFKVINMKRDAATFNTIIAAVTGIAGSMIGISLIVGGIGIMNIMLVTVTERTREIGLRKAVGAKRLHILLQFLTEATILCILGGTIGILLGFATCALIGTVAFNQVPRIPLWAVIAGFGVPAAIGIFFGYYPASKASKLDPIESLRFE